MFITNKPAMIIENRKERYLLIGDLHLGLTSEWRRKGVSAYSQVKDFISKISEMKKQTKASHLVMIGDVKHKVTGISWQEEHEIPEFLSLLEKMFKKVIIIKGNHDGHIEKLIEKKSKVKVVKSLIIGEYFITHGHRKVKTRKKYIIIGHNQPAVKLRDRIGASYTIPCWVIGKIKDKDQELIIMPAFNPLSGSGIVNENEFIGPIAKYLDTKNAKIHLLDGTDLGELKDLKIRTSD
ncbi:MAG: metallophosphoesterase [Candidatus Aenigmarchaeota archaeon]|nr:metallophosphoesterase [Candidatus Aenigmarchaeota archaeon]